MMFGLRQTAAALLVAATTCTFATTAHAAVITTLGQSILPGFSTGTIGSFGVTPAPNNDNVTGANPNGFTYNLFINSLGLIEVEFVVANSGGTTEYRVGQNFLDNSGQPWTSFTFELGFGTGASFVRSGNDGLDFDTPDRDPLATAIGFTVLDHQSDLLRWSGGVIPLLGSVQFGFAIDVPDNLQAANPYGLARFTLRQTPNASVPEPATMVMVGIGLLGATLRRRR